MEFMILFKESGRIWKSTVASNIASNSYIMNINPPFDIVSIISNIWYTDEVSNEMLFAKV